MSWQDTSYMGPGPEDRFPCVRLYLNWHTDRRAIRSDVLRQVATALINGGTDWFSLRGNKWVVDPVKLRSAFQLDDFDWLIGLPIVVEPDFTPADPAESKAALVTLSFEPTSFEQPEPQPEPGTTSMAYDIAVVCALHERELDSVLRTGQQPWQPRHIDGDPTTYYETIFPRENARSLRVVAAAALHMGMPASAVLATKMILRFMPSMVAMVGIAAGADAGKQGFGDILTPDITFDYGSGKLVSEGDGLRLKPDAKPLPIEARLAARLLDWKRQRRHLDAIRQAWPADKPKAALDIHVGPLGSGSAVLESKKPLSEVTEHWRKLIGIEMEAHGVHLACQSANTPKPWFLCMKSICDFAAEKTDAWQAYAAFTAAQLFYRFVTEEWEVLAPPSLKHSPATVT